MGWGWLKTAAWWAVGGPMVGAAKMYWDYTHRRVPTPAARVPQTSVYGVPLPIVWGKTRITGSMIYYKKSGSFPSVYENGMVIALCEGPITGISRVWRDKKAQAVTWVDGTESSALGGRLFAFKAGTRPTQSAWSVLSTVDASAALVTYPGVAYVTYQTDVAPDMVEGYSWEVKAFRFGTGGADGDAHPADVMYDFLTDASWGCGIAPARVVTDVGQDGTANSSLRRYVSAEGFWVSPALTEQRAAREHLRELLDCFNAEVVWSDATFKFIPYGDVAVTGNSVTYTPVTTIRYALTNADFLDEEQPVQVDVEPDTDRWNIWPVEFLERAPTAAASDPSHAYNVAVVESPEPVDVANFGPRRAPTASLHAICLRSVAQRIAQIRAQRSVLSRATYRFRLPFQFGRLEPMDLVTLTDVCLGISARVVRVTAVEEDAELTLTVTAEEWPFGIGGSVEHATESSESSVVWTDAEAMALEPAARDGSNIPDNTIPGGVLSDGSLPYGKLSVDAVRSADYAENVSGSATAGFKWFAGGTGVVGKIGPGGCMVGAYALDEAVLATLTSIARTGTAAATDLCWYRGNSTGVPKLYTATTWASGVAKSVGDDCKIGIYVAYCISSGTTGGTQPTFSGAYGQEVTDGTVIWKMAGTVAECGERLWVQSFFCPVADTNAWLINLRFQMRSATPFDNHDGMRRINVTLYDQNGDVPSASGATSGFATAWPDRMYRQQVPYYHADNNQEINAHFLWWGANSPRYGSPTYAFNGYLQIKLHNSFGASASRNYRLGANTIYTWMTAGVTIPGAVAPPPVGGDGGGSGGTCVAPETPILMADGTEKPAGALRVGDQIWTLPDGQRAAVEWGGFAVAAVSRHHSPRAAVAFADGRRLVCSPLHRVLLGDGQGFVSASLLRAGDRVCGAPGRSGVVERVDQAQDGEVVKITVTGAGTYVSEGLLSHNVKPRT